jgi:hypothetical protein
MEAIGDIKNRQKETVNSYFGQYQFLLAGPYGCLMLSIFYYSTIFKVLQMVYMQYVLILLSVDTIYGIMMLE